VTKLHSTGAVLVYSTYLGGVDADSGQGIALDANANAYVAGSTASKDFPITAGAFQPVFSDALNRFPVPDAFVAKIVDLVPPPPPTPTSSGPTPSPPLLPPVLLPPPPVLVPPLPLILGL
jgi:hypothetical protein